MLLSKVAVSSIERYRSAHFDGHIRLWNFRGGELSKVHFEKSSTSRKNCGTSNSGQGDLLKVHNREGLLNYSEQVFLRPKSN